MRVTVICQDRSAFDLTGPDREAFETCDRIARETDGFEGYLMGWGDRASIRVLNGAHGLGADARRRALYACSLQVRYCAG